jgi:hypothetical protein
MIRALEKDMAGKSWPSLGGNLGKLLKKKKSE